MQMTFRWFGKDLDTVSLEQIKQIPGVVGVVPALHYLPAGEAWEMEDVQKMYDEITAAGLTMECIESVNVHEDIKLGLPTRDKLIENYKKSIRNLAKVGVKVICYNFMPVFDWTRTDLYMPLPDGSTCLSYDGKQVEGKSPEDMFKEIDDNSNGYAMPGWETERMGEIKELFAKYITNVYELKIECDKDIVSFENLFTSREFYVIKQLHRSVSEVISNIGIDETEIKQYNEEQFNSYYLKKESNAPQNEQINVFIHEIQKGIEEYSEQIKLCVEEFKHYF